MLLHDRRVLKPKEEKKRRSAHAYDVSVGSTASSEVVTCVLSLSRALAFEHASQNNRKTSQYEAEINWEKLSITIRRTYLG